MKTTMKKVLSMTLALILLLGTLPMTALADGKPACVTLNPIFGTHDHHSEICEMQEEHNNLRPDCYDANNSGYCDVCWAEMPANDSGNEEEEETPTCPYHGAGHALADCPFNPNNPTTQPDSPENGNGDGGSGSSGGNATPGNGEIVNGCIWCSSTEHTAEDVLLNRAECQTSNNGSTTTPPATSNATCGICGRTGHTHWDCPWGSPDDTAPTCQLCKQVGHTHLNCPTYSPSQPSGGTTTTPSTGTYTIGFVPNYDIYNDPHNITGVAAGTKIYDIYTPLRTGYLVEAWYEDADMTRLVSRDAVVTGNDTYYAKWKQVAAYNVSVVIFTNGNKQTSRYTLDLFEWAQDGEITLTDIKAAVAKYGIEANNAAGLSVYGPFTPNQWISYVDHDYYRNTAEKVKVYTDQVTVLYAMVHNVKINNGTTSSGSTADSTNPKTGDMIYMPVAVLGLSASALAVMFYLKKKRAF